MRKKIKSLLFLTSMISLPTKSDYLVLNDIDFEYDTIINNIYIEPEFYCAKKSSLSNGTSVENYSLINDDLICEYINETKTFNIKKEPKKDMSLEDVEISISIANTSEDLNQLDLLLNKIFDFEDKINNLNYFKSFNIRINSITNTFSEVYKFGSIFPISEYYDTEYTDDYIRKALNSDINISNHDAFPAGVAGAVGPTGSPGIENTTIYLNNDYFNDNSTTLEHEFGHLLGLSHGLFNKIKLHSNFLNYEVDYDFERSSTDVERSYLQGYVDLDNLEASAMTGSNYVVLKTNKGRVINILRDSFFAGEKQTKHSDFGYVESDISNLSSDEYITEIANEWDPDSGYKFKQFPTQVSNIPNGNNSLYEIAKNLYNLSNKNNDNRTKLININNNENNFIILSDKRYLTTNEDYSMKKPIEILTKEECLKEVKRGDSCFTSNIDEDEYYATYGNYKIDFNLNKSNKLFLPHTNSYSDKNALFLEIDNFSLLEDTLLFSNKFLNQLEYDIKIENMTENDFIIGFKITIIDLNINKKIVDINAKIEDIANKEYTNYYIESFSQENSNLNNVLNVYEAINEESIDQTGFGRVIIGHNLIGSHNSNIINGTKESELISGLDSDDVLGDSFGSIQWRGELLDVFDKNGDIFIGGKDNDVIYGTRYGDTYIYEFGDGNDVIHEIGDLDFESDILYKNYIKDKIELKNIKNQDISISRNNYDVIVEIKKYDENFILKQNYITIKNMLKQSLFEGHYYHNHAMEEIILDDIILYKNDVIQQALIVKGTQNNDIITGLNEYVNIFESSLGVDTYIGSTNDDVYNISSNVGSLTIQESAGNDEINFTGLTNLTFIEEDGDVNVYDSDDNLIVKIEGFTPENNLIETINVDGVSYTSATFDDLVEKSNYSFIQIDCGDNHCLAIDTNNEMWFSGDEGMMNNSGFFGDGSNRTFTTTWQNSGIKNVSHIEAMQLQSYYISNGEVYYAGFDNSNFTVTNNWKKLSGISNVKKLASNGTTTLALTESGEVFAIGGNMSNEAGVGSSSTSSWARAKTNSGYVTGATDIAIGSFQSFVLIGDEVYSAGTDGGSGNLGRTGNGDIFQSTGLTGVSQIASGNESGYALKSGVVYSVGYNKYGELGLGHRNNKSSFTSTGLTDVSHISASGSYIIALKNNSIYFSGVNYYGQAGNGSSGIYDSFVKTMSPNFEIDNIEADYSNMTGFTILWSKNSDVAYSGGNYAGQAGDGSGVDTKNMISYTISE